MNPKNKKPEDLEENKSLLPHSGLASDVFSTEAKAPVLTVGPPPTGPDRLYEFADDLARNNKEDTDKKEEDRLETWVTFMLSAECFGLPVTHVQEILRVSSITRVPHAPHPVRGVTNMRGKVLPVVDLRVRLGLAEREIDSQSRILVVSSHGRQMGLLVDSVQQVVRLSLNKVQPPPPDIMTTQSDYILGVYHLQEMLAILLDVDRVLYIRDSLQEAIAR